MGTTGGVEEDLAEASTAPLEDNTGKRKSIDLQLGEDVRAKLEAMDKPAEQGETTPDGETSATEKMSLEPGHRERADSYQNWADFWREMKKSKHIAEPMYLDCEYFEGASSHFFFYKLGQNPTEHLPGSLAKVCNNLPFLKRKFKAKWQQRYGILLPNGLLVYFLNDQPKSIALGCICLSGIKIDEDNVQDSANNLVYLSLTSRHPRRPKKKVFQWKVGAQTEDECALLKERILKHQ